MLFEYLHHLKLLREYPIVQWVQIGWSSNPMGIIGLRQGVGCPVKKITWKPKRLLL